MKCQLCSNVATVHLTKIVNKQKTEVHLCQSCAEKQHAPPASELSLSAILQSLIGQHVSSTAEELARLNCPTCGIKYMEFRADGRLGCPADYEVFRAGLLPILERIHRATRHVGKVPRRQGAANPLRGSPGGGRPGPARTPEVLELRQQLRRAVETENYERAAALRDLIRQKEASDEPG
jgi:protein arginine kinase activator